MTTTSRPTSISLFSHRINMLCGSSAPNARSRYSCQVAIEGSNRYSELLRSLRLRVSPAEHVAQPDQRSPAELLGPPAQLPPGANLRPTVALCSYGATPPTHFIGGHWFFAPAPQPHREV